MKSTTLTRAGLAEAINSEVGLSCGEAAQIVDTLLDEIIAALVDGDTVKISRFGRLQVRSKSKRMGRNPKTGKEVPITSRRVLTFRASHMLKNRVNAAMGGAVSFDEGDDGDDDE